MKRATALMLVLLQASPSLAQDPQDGVDPVTVGFFSFLAGSAATGYIYKKGLVRMHEECALMSEKIRAQEDALRNKQKEMTRTKNALTDRNF